MVYFHKLINADNVIPIYSKNGFSQGLTWERKGAWKDLNDAFEPALASAEAKRMTTKGQEMCVCKHLLIPLREEGTWEEEGRQASGEEEGERGPKSWREGQTEPIQGKIWAAAHFLPPPLCHTDVLRLRQHWCWSGSQWRGARCWHITFLPPDITRVICNKHTHPCGRSPCVAFFSSCTFILGSCTSVISRLLI